MKSKIYLLVVLLFNIYIYSVEARVDIGLKGGLNLSVMSGYPDRMVNDGDGNWVKLSTSYVASYHLGLIFQYHFDREFFIQPELLYSKQGRKDVCSTMNTSSVVSLSYIKLPVYGGYKYNVGENLDLLIGAGPYLAYGVSFGNDDFRKEYKKNDWGVAFMGGIQWDNLQITIGAELGLYKLKSLTDLLGNEESVIHNRNFTFSIACFF